MKIIDIVRKGNESKFLKLQDSNLWYRATWIIQGEGILIEDTSLHVEVEQTFDFPIPIEDTKGEVFYPAMSSVRLMRWIRKHLEVIEVG